MTIQKPWIAQPMPTILAHGAFTGGTLPAASPSRDRLPCLRAGKG